jgi:hypothetical protein
MKGGKGRWAGPFLAVLVLLSGCSVITGASSGRPSGAGEGFAIYLTRDGVPVDRMEMMSHVEIADTPVIGPDDLVAYDWDTHEMTLTPEAYQRLTELHPPMNGIAFVACVDRQPVYRGAFWTLVSSYWYPLPAVIYVDPFMSDDPAHQAVQIRSGASDDPRSNPVIRNALEAAGKLKQARPPW